LQQVVQKIYQFLVLRVSKQSGANGLVCVSSPYFCFRLYLFKDSLRQRFGQSQKKDVGSHEQSELAKQSGLD